MGDASTLRNHCFISSSAEGDSFVGIRSDGDSLSVFFPLGYTIPADESLLRRDIMNLILVLSKFSGAKDKNIVSQHIYSHETVSFPIQAYMGIMSAYRNSNSNLYTEREVRYERGRKSGKVSWARTIKDEKPIWSNGSPFYLDFVTRGNYSNAEKLITLVHEYCVHESYTKVGFLFPGDEPPLPRLQYDREMFRATVLQKKAQVMDDKVNQLLDDMLSIINYLGDKNGIPQYYFGTDRFEYVWERLIDFTFGEDDKEDYFPRTSWVLFDEEKRNSALEPDTIMVVGSKVFVLDAKYYRYGHTKDASHLPQSSSINKQITYGEYIASMDGLREKFGEQATVFNAFLMPYSMFNRRFAAPSAEQRYRHIGEAVSDWKPGKFEYEHVQGILIDIRSLMHNYVRHNEPEIKNLADLIEAATRQSLPSV